MKQNNFGTMHQAKVGLTVISIVAGAGILLFFVLMPQIAAVEKIKYEIDENERQITQIQNEVKSYQEAHSALRKVTGSDSVPQIFTRKEDMVDLVKGLETAVELSGGSHSISLVDLEEQGTPEQPAEEPEPVISGLTKLREVPYTFQFYGDYRQTLNLLMSLENLPYVTVLTRVSLSAESTQLEGAPEVTNTGNAFSQINGLFFIKKK